MSRKMELENCENCGLEILGNYALKWKGLQGKYCSAECAAYSCPNGNLVKVRNQKEE